GCIRIMQGEQDPRSKDLIDLTLERAAWMFFLGERGGSVAEGKQLASELLSGGKALSKFREMVRLHSGDAGVADDVGKLPRAKHQAEVHSNNSGYVTSMECEKLGVAAVVLGGGRERKEDGIDHAVGLLVHKKVGDRVERGAPLCTLLYNSATRLDEAKALAESAYSIGAQKVSPTPLIRQVVGAEAVREKTVPQTAR